MAAERKRNTAALATVLASLPVLGGCYASSVVAVTDRSIATDQAALPWRPATRADLDGLFGSIEIRGDAAVALRNVWYLFDQGGRYTGAALVDTDDGPAFQTLTGTWDLLPPGLVLDGADPVACSAAPGHLRIEAHGGTLVLRAEGAR